MPRRLTWLRSFPLHSFLLGLYPIFYLYSRNVTFIPAVQTVRAFALATGVMLLFLLGFRLIVRDWARAGLLASLLALLFFSFGHVAMSLEAVTPAIASPVEELALTLLYLAGFLALSLAIVRIRVSPAVTSFINLASIALYAVPLVISLAYAVDQNGPSATEVHALARLRGDDQAQSHMGAQPAVEAPDIYYIVLDGYEGAQTLRQSYGYDNSGFLDSLRQRGFYVAEQSRSNYLSTNYSLSGTLNLVYFEDLPSGIRRGARYNLRVNFVTEFLRQHGYSIVVFDSGTGNTNDQYADEFLSPESSSAHTAPAFNPFELLLVRTTMARLLIGQGGEPGSDGSAVQAVRNVVNQELEVRRERIRFAFDRLPEFAANERQDFVFAHIYSPHIPFLYGPSGVALEYQGDPGVDWYLVGPDKYVQDYGYQLDYLNAAVLNAVDKIQRAASGPLVIILQSDHGDDFLLDWKNPTARGVQARSSILNAIYFSDGSYQQLYPTITPVNTFRAVFNAWFGTGYRLLPDRSFYHVHPVSTGYLSKLRFYDSCAAFDICLPVQGGQ